MNAKHIAIAAVAAAIAIAAIVAAIRTRPTLPSETPPAGRQGALPGDPLKEPMVVHMVEDGHLDAGPDTTHQLAIIAQEDRVRVVLSSELLDTLGPGALERLGLTAPEESMRWSRYERFLEDLHDLWVRAHPEIHEHDHGEHDHEHGEDDHNHGHGEHDHGEHDHDHGDHDHETRER